MKMWVCENEKCGWVGRFPGRLSAGGIAVKVCRNCLKSTIHQEEIKKQVKEETHE